MFSVALIAAIEFGGSGEALNAVAVATLMRVRFAAN
jgi:hypothetical protein